jgi:hypothetical protein
MRRVWPLLMVGALLGAGCGSQGSSAVAPRPLPTPDQHVSLPDGYGAQPGASAPGAAGKPDAQAQALLAQMNQALQAMRGASYGATMYCRGAWGHKPNKLALQANGEWEATTVYTALYKQPGIYRIAVSTCTNAASNGMKMLVRQQQVQVKLTGLLSVLPISKTLDDPEVKNFRGHRLDETSFEGLGRRFGAQPPADARLTGQAALEGRTVDLIEVPHAPSFDRAIQREVIGLDRQTHLPLYDAMFTAQEKVWELKLRNLKTNVAVSEADLAL